MISPLPTRQVGSSEFDFHAFCIVEREGEAPCWIRCGHARLNADGSLNVRLDALPLSGRLHLRPPSPLPRRDAVTDRPVSAPLAPPPTTLHS